MTSIFSRSIARPAKRRSLQALNRCRLGRSRQIRLPGIILAMLFCIQLLAQEAKQSPRAIAGASTKAAETPIKYSAIRYESANRRDPFLNPLLLKKKAKKIEDEEISRGLPPPGIAGTYIAQAVLQGTTIRDGGKVAVVRGADARAYFLRVGDRLFDGYVKEIQNDFITLVRETKMKSGKTLTQDVTKRLRTP
jgi:Tfp pilus assembly protein PilP